MDTLGMETTSKGNTLCNYSDVKKIIFGNVGLVLVANMAIVTT